MVVPVCFMVVAWTYALAVNFIPSYRDPADRIGAATIGIENAGDESSRCEPEDDLVKGAVEHREAVV